ncbi:MAG: PA2779 family protein [Dissulfurispiraceae bacterium]
MNIPFMKQIAWYLVVAMFVIGIAPRVDAGLVPSEVITLTQADRQADLSKIQKVLETKMIIDRLAQYGLTRDEINARLAQLSDQQLHNFVLQLDDLKVGGLGSQGVAVGFVLIAVILLVIIIRYLTGHKGIV